MPFFKPLARWFHPAHTPLDGWAKAGILLLCFGIGSVLTIGVSMLLGWVLALILERSNSKERRKGSS